MYRAIPDRRGEANTLQSLGDLESDLKNTDLARAAYQAAITIAERIPDRVCILNALMGLARLERRIGNAEAAEQYYQQILALVQGTAFEHHAVIENLRKEFEAMTTNDQPAVDSSALWELFLKADDDITFSLLVSMLPDAVLDELEKAAEEYIAQAASDEAILLRERLDSLRRKRAQGSPKVNLQAEMLFNEFATATNRGELPQFLQKLSETGFTDLYRVLEQKIVESADARQTEMLKRALAAIHQFQDEEPLNDRLRAFLSSDDDMAARAILLGNPGLLLTDKAWEELNDFSSDDADAKARIEQRKVLWQQVHTEYAQPQPATKPAIVQPAIPSESPTPAKTGETPKQAAFPDVIALLEQAEEQALSAYLALKKEKAPNSEKARKLADDIRKLIDEQE